MSIHHLNCGTLHPRQPNIRSLCYVLLVESSDGLVLVDSGFGLQDYSQPTPFVKFLLWLWRVPRLAAETARQQVIDLGCQPEDMRHIVMTHLHVDHAGGLRDFPQAQVHVHRREREASQHPRTLMELFYIPAHWAHQPCWVLYDQPDGDWFGFESIRILPGVEPEMRLIPLFGHTRGHCGVAIRSGSGWLLHCGDAESPYQRNVDIHQRGAGYKQIRLFLPGWLAASVIGPHVARLRGLIQQHGDQVRVVSAHDSYSFEER